MSKKTTAIPASAIRVRTYAELRPWIEQYRAGKLNFITILSSPGLLKTTLLQELVGRHDDASNPGQGLWIEGNDSAFIAHCRIWEKMGDPQGPQHDLLILDDVEKTPALLQTPTEVCKTESISAPPETDEPKPQSVEANLSPPEASKGTDDLAEEELDVPPRNVTASRRPPKPAKPTQMPSGDPKVGDESLTDMLKAILTDVAEDSLDLAEILDKLHAKGYRTAAKQKNLRVAVQALLGDMVKSGEVLKSEDRRYSIRRDTGLLV